MGVINWFYEKVSYIFAALGSVLIVGFFTGLLWNIIPRKDIALFSILCISTLLVIVYVGVLFEFLCNKKSQKEESIKNKYKKELCDSLDKSINVLPSQMPFWLLYRFMRYLNSIPEYVFASDDNKQSIYNEIKESTSKVFWVLSNDSVRHSIYSKMLSDRRSEVVDVVKNTLTKETKVVQDIKKRSEQYRQSLVKEEKQGLSRGVDDFLDEYYAKERDR
jgi:hypothetical protein